MALLRSAFDALGYVKSETLATLSLARPVKAAGIVLIRQRPGSASGVIFSTIEDETGIANLIIWPKVFERYRRIVLSARLLGVRGKLQREQGVIHLVARELFDMSSLLTGLSEKHGSGSDFLSSTDEVQKPAQTSAQSRRGTRPSRASVAEGEELSLIRHVRSETGDPAICPGRGSRRCLIPASGYFEWATIAMPDKPKPLKQPFYITRQDALPLTFAGLWERWKDGMLSCTILTCEACDGIRDLHNRMPVMLAPDGFEPWLTGADPIVESHS